MLFEKTPGERDVILLVLRYLRVMRKWGNGRFEACARAKRELRLRREENVAGSREVRELL